MKNVIKNLLEKRLKFNSAFEKLMNRICDGKHNLMGVIQQANAVHSKRYGTVLIKKRILLKFLDLKEFKMSNRHQVIYVYFQ